MEYNRSISEKANKKPLQHRLREIKEYCEWEAIEKPSAFSVKNSLITSTFKFKINFLIVSIVYTLLFSCFTWGNIKYKLVWYIQKGVCRMAWIILCRFYKYLHVLWRRNLILMLQYSTLNILYWLIPAAKIINSLYCSYCIERVRHGGINYITLNSIICTQCDYTLW